MKTIVAMIAAALITAILTVAVLKSKQADNEAGTNLDCNETGVGFSDDGSTVTFGQGIRITIDGLDLDDDAQNKVQGALILLGCK